MWYSKIKLWSAYEEIKVPQKPMDAVKQLYTYKHSSKCGAKIIDCKDAPQRPTTKMHNFTAIL